MAEPQIRILPEGGVYSDYELACEIGADYGWEAMPWQRDLLRDILMEDEDGLHVCNRIGFSAPRRQGKTILVLIATLFKMTVEGASVAYTAHLSKSSREIWKPLRAIFEETDLRDEVKRISGERGHETIELHNGAKFELFTRQEGSGSGRGSKADVLILDESYDLPEGTLADLTPMTRNSSKPLVIFLGSPAYEQSANGQAFRNIRTNVLNGSAPRNGWIEYGAPEGADIHDREVWFATNPAVEGGYLTERQLESDILSGDLSEQKILVEYLGSWHALNRPCIVDISKFGELGGLEFQASKDSELVVALDSDPEGRMTSVCVAGYTPDHLPVVEVVEHAPGTSWVPQMIRRMSEAQPSIKIFIIDSQSVLKVHAEALQAEGYPVAVTSTEFMSLAAPAFVEAYGSGSFRHRGSAVLRSSILGAANRKLMGRNVWKKADADSDITTVTAAALSLHGLGSEKAVSKLKKPKTGKVYVGGKVYERQ